MLVILFLILMEGGCMRSREECESISKSAVDYLEEKYKQDFSFYAYEEGDILSDITYVRCLTGNMNLEHENVIVTVRQEGNRLIFADNYFAYLIRPELEDYIRNIVKTEFQEMKVYVENQNDFFSSDFDSKSTLEELYQIDSLYQITVKVYIKGNAEIPEAEYKEKMQRIEKKLMDSGHSYTIYIFAVSPEIYSTIERYEQKDFWYYYIKNQEPDGEKYYYLYHNIITEGALTWQN